MISLGTHITTIRFLSKDRLIVVYSSNKFLIHDVTTQKIKEIAYPENYLTRFNRVYGCVELSANKFLLYTHYTTILVNLDKEVPAQAQILQDHPFEAGETWMDKVKAF